MPYPVTQVAAHYPKAFANHTHLVIDEVHERSLDMDSLCYFARLLLRTHRSLRLVLMSATANAAIYQEYFGVLEAPLFVGVRCYPLTVHYLETFSTAEVLPRPVKALAVKLQEELPEPPSRQLQEQQLKQQGLPPPGVLRAQLELAFQLTAALSQPGQCILVFVSGLNDMQELSLKFAGRGARYQVYALHSMIPLEDQLKALEQVPSCPPAEGGREGGRQGGRGGGGQEVGPLNLSYPKIPLQRPPSFMLPGLGALNGSVGVIMFRPPSITKSV